MAERRHSRRCLRTRRPVAEHLEDRRLPATFTVTSNQDAPIPGRVTLRDAINAANQAVGPDVIDFAIQGSGPFVISTVTPLPALTDAAGVRIDGTTQPGYAGRPVVFIDGSKSTVAGDGLLLAAGPNTITGLAIGGFAGAGIHVRSDGNAVTASWLGVNFDVTGSTGNARAGLLLEGSADNTIGGSIPVDSNVISGNLSDGVVLQDDGTAPSTRNLITGNIVGGTPDGSRSAGNGKTGILLTGAADGNAIGGAGKAGNVIVGNGADGIALLGANAGSNRILGNRIGTDTGGTLRLGNGANGVHIVGASNNTIGGNVSGDGNSIAFNTGLGVLLDAGQGNGIFVNSIYSNGGGGISLINRANRVQAAPKLTSATQTSSGLTVTGSVDGFPGLSYQVRFFSDIGDPSGFGQGRTPLGSTFFAMDSSGTRSFSVDLPVTVDPSLVITATATPVELRDSSAFSNDQPIDLSTVVINTNDSGFGSLRQAILNADRRPGRDAITFKIPGAGVQTIAPLTPLPEITEAVDILGATQPGFAGTPVVELSGVNLKDATADGLVVRAGGSTVRNLAINRFPTAGIHVRDVSGVVLTGLFVGTDATGATALGNGRSGIIIQDASNATVGGLAVGDGNVVSGNTVTAGIEIFGASTGNTILGNRIGTDAAGAKAVANATGILITGASGNVVGGAAGGGNVISGNMIGIALRDGANATTVLGNRIGTDAAGGAAVPNVEDGLYIANSAGNIVGGSAAGTGNVIAGNGISGVHIFGTSASGNGLYGNRIGTDAAGNAALANSADGVFIEGAPNNTVGGGNVVSGNGEANVQIFGADAVGNLVVGSLIGTDATGVRRLGATAVGVFINDAPTNTVGGAAPGAGNLVSGNDVGIEFYNPGARGNLALGNRVGTDAAGTSAVPNRIGIVALNAPGNFIGGTAEGAGNVVSGNSLTGVRLAGAGTTGNVVLGNRIGTDAAGTGRLANASTGVFIDAPENIVGGSTAGARNIVSGNGDAGIQLYGVAASGNLIAGNYIGTDITGSRPLGNGIDGIYVNNAHGNTIGGTTTEAGNLVSANAIVGIQIFGAKASGNVVQGNRIGTDAAGAATLGNDYGIYIETIAANTIGGRGPGQANDVRGNRIAQVFIIPANQKPTTGSVATVAAQSSGASVGTVTVRFLGNLRPSAASRAANYAIVAGARRLRVSAATYDALTHTVSLSPAKALPAGGGYRLLIGGRVTGGRTQVVPFGAAAISPITVDALFASPEAPPSPVRSARRLGK